MHTEDHFRDIYRQGVTHVRTCDCGMVHLGIGPVTVKLTRDAFDQVLQGVVEAGRRLASPTETVSASPLLRVVEGTIQ